MIQAKKRVSIVWFKRDLRLTDHEPLARAERSGLPIILLYVFEPIQISDPHYSEGHWRFVSESLLDINSRLKGKVSVANDDVLLVFQTLQKSYEISGVYSHQETGLANTFARDKQIAAWFKSESIVWYESQTNAVVRPCNNRLSWDASWRNVMRRNLIENNAQCLSIETFKFDTSALPKIWLTPDSDIQPGGETHAQKVLDDFLDSRGKSYQKFISKPQRSQLSCSRMSPYLAWGNISIRQMYQQLLENWNRQGWRRPLVALSSRLYWHCHFVQKFESESSMQFTHINDGYKSMPYRDVADSVQNLIAWKEGQTGYPMVDACMRSLHKTGYLNFRMRAMLVSFLAHHLQIDWRRGVEHLACVFLDFEPGIHYAQFQMQAGVTGINTIRIYNLTKQAKEHDSDGEFIRTWCPELSNLPNALLFEPWLLTPMDELMYEIKLGEQYPKPIVDIKDTYTETSKRPDVKREAHRILQRHVR